MTVRSLEHRTKVPEIRKGDTVLVLAGRDAGKRGKVERVIRRDASPSPVRSGYRRTSLKGRTYGLNAPLPVERVMVVCSHCDRPTRIAHRTLDNGTRVRVCRHCAEPLEVRS